MTENVTPMRLSHSFEDKKLSEISSVELWKLWIISNGAWYVVIGFILTRRDPRIYHGRTYEPRNKIRGIRCSGWQSLSMSANESRITSASLKWKPVNSNGIKSALYRLIKNQLVQDCDYSYICICCWILYSKSRAWFTNTPSGQRRRKKEKTCLEIYQEAGVYTVLWKVQGGALPLLFNVSDISHPMTWPRREWE